MSLNVYLCLIRVSPRMGMKHKYKAIRSEILKNTIELNLLFYTNPECVELKKNSGSAILQIR